MKFAITAVLLKIQRFITVNTWLSAVVYIMLLGTAIGIGMQLMLLLVAKITGYDTITAVYIIAGLWFACIYSSGVYIPSNTQSVHRYITMLNLAFFYLVVGTLILGGSLITASIVNSTTDTIAFGLVLEILGFLITISIFASEGAPQLTYFIVIPILASLTMPTFVTDNMSLRTAILFCIANYSIGGSIGWLAIRRYWLIKSSIQCLMHSAFRNSLIIDETLLVWKLMSIGILAYAYASVAGAIALWCLILRNTVI